MDTQGEKTLKEDDAAVDGDWKIGGATLLTEGAEMTEIEEVEHMFSSVIDGSVDVKTLARGALNFVLSIPMRIVNFYLWLLVSLFYGCLYVAYLPVQITVAVLASVYSVVLTKVVHCLNCAGPAGAAHRFPAATNGHTASH